MFVFIKVNHKGDYKEPLKTMEESINKVKTPINGEEGINLEKRYEILIRARNFHYENFNKWMSYFYVMIGSVILGFSYIISKSNDYNNKYHYELIVLALLGFIISLFWHWANKGYYYWNINFITLVNHYEKNLLNFKESERIYFTFANKNIQNNYFDPISGANISTSKISILLSYIFSVFFATYGISQVLTDFISYKGLLILVSIVFSLFIILVLGSFAKKFLSSYHNHFPDLKIDSTNASIYKSNNNLKV